MKRKVSLISFSIISLLLLMLMLARENIYIVAAILAGILLLGHREIWSLIRYRHWPVIDERVRDNLTGAMRLTGIFFFLASIMLIILLRFEVLKDTPLELVISGQLVIVGIVYLISYYYYDRARPNLGKGGLRWLRICLTTAGLAICTAALAIALHNLVSYWFNFEDAFFFILGLLAAPAVFVISLLVCLGIYISGLFGTTGRGETQ